MARKVTTRKRHGGGMEAPRNSLELPMERLYGLYAATDNILYADDMTKELSCMDHYSTEAPIKKLISKEISRRPNTKQYAPSVVARLMGVDRLPFDTKPTPQPVDKKNHSPTGKLMVKETSKKGSSSNCSEQLGVASFEYCRDRYPDPLGSSYMKLKKPKPREHPQEEELQKFKKEFEAWQVARFNECSNVMKFSRASAQLIAQEDLNREKMFVYANSKRTTNSEKLREPNDPAQMLGPHEMPTFGSCKKKNLCCSAEGKESIYPNRMSKTDIGPSHLDTAKIVVLRPGPDRMFISDDSWNSTPSTSEERVSIQDFLEEVKERLKSELQGDCSKRCTNFGGGGGGIETPYWEKPSEPKKLAWHIAQEVRDSVPRELGMNLLRSESTRSYISEMQLNGADSPEFIDRDARRFLAQRLRNVMKGETLQEFPRNRSRLSMSNYDSGGSDNTLSYADSSTANELEKQSRSFRGEPDDEDGTHQKDLSLRNLVRSLSAPVSGASFGKLLLEDRHILTGAQIRRKHEVVEKVSLNIKKQKDKFNIKEKVSSFRYSLTLRGRLFRRRVKATVGLDQTIHQSLKDITNGPTMMMNVCETHENSTEVPPSPASVCSSVHEEFWRSAGYLSPISSTGGHQLEDIEMSHVFRETNSNLNELRRKLNQLEGAVPEETINEHQPTEAEVDIEGQAEAYIRDLLIAAGLCDGSFNRTLSKWDPLGKSISNQVFEEVEENYKRCSSEHDERRTNDDGEPLNHKMILDLLNEVLPAILREPANTSRQMEKAIDPHLHNPPNGRKLLSQVWNIIRVYIHPPVDRSYHDLDNMLARHLNANPWSRVMDDDVNAVGKDIEYGIIGDMIEEMVKDIYSTW